LLRGEAPEAGHRRWCSAREIVDEAVEAIRGERYSEFEAALAMDARPQSIRNRALARPLGRRDLARPVSIASAMTVTPSPWRGIALASGVE